jgi:hypothetical protein
VVGERGTAVRCRDRRDTEHAEFSLGEVSREIATIEASLEKRQCFERLAMEGTHHAVTWEYLESGWGIK